MRQKWRKIERKDESMSKKGKEISELEWTS